MGIKGIKIPQAEIAGVHGVDMGIEGYHFGSIADTPDHIAQGVDEYFIKTRGYHLIFDAEHHVLFLGAKGGDRHHIGEEAYRLIFVLHCFCQDLFIH
ncbi:hypothetical protein DSECCO2_598260 [anaerobic digester metagenome]